MWAGRLGCGPWVFLPPLLRETHPPLFQLGCSLGLTLDPWQCLQLQLAYGALWSGAQDVVLVRLAKRLSQGAAGCQGTC